MIPKLIHQTYKQDDNLPPVYVRCQAKILEMHPGWKYKFWTDEAMYAEVAENFPELLAAFMRLPRKILQIDVFRYCLMWRYGGLYADLDYVFRKPFDLLDKELVLPTSRTNAGIPVRFGNCIFASRPGHPFWKLLIDDIIKNESRFIINSDSDVMDSKDGTGPGFVTHMYFSCSDEIKSRIYVPLRLLFHPPSSYKEDDLERVGSYGQHLCESLWTLGRL